jgi:hypothetical protein
MQSLVTRLDLFALAVVLVLAFALSKLYLRWASSQRRMRARPTATATATANANAEQQRATLLRAVRSGAFQRVAAPLMRFWCAAPKRSAVLFASLEDATQLRVEVVLDLRLERHLRLRGLSTLLPGAQRALAASRDVLRELVVVAAARSNADLLLSHAAPPYACVLRVAVAATHDGEQPQELEFDTFVQTIRFAM